MRTHWIHFGMVYFWYSETDDVAPLYTNDASNDRRRMSSEDIENAQDMLEPIKMYAAYAISLYK